MVKAIETCDASSRLFPLQEHVTELYAVNGYATEYMHVDEPLSLAVPQDAEALGYVKRTLLLMDNI
jgi:hypothetical protein